MTSFAQTPARPRWLAHLWSSLAAAALFVAGLHYQPFSAPTPGAGPFYFQAVVKASEAGDFAIAYELLGGRKHVAEDRIRRVGAPQLCRMELPAGRIVALRLLPIAANREIAITNPAVVDEAGRSVAVFSAAQFQAITRSTEIRVAGKNAFIVRAGAEAAVVNIYFDAPLVLASPAPFRWGVCMLHFLAATFVIFLGLRVIDSRFERWLAGAADWFHARPLTSVFLAAVAAVLVACHPVVFAAKSFVAPATAAPCLYGIPKATDPAGEAPEDPKGSDTGATVWAHVPYSVIAHRAVFEHGELPLWMRENSCGLALLGQGQSMIGDPLHWIAIAAGGAAWAWDLKFVLARVLFALGIGLCVFALTRHVPVAMLLAASSVFIGFFAYRLNHTAYFSLCYSPWILLCWLKAAEAESAARLLACGASLIVVNWIELNSGTAKESAMLLVCLNATGALAVALAPRPTAARWRVLGAMLWSGLLFVLLSAPAWMVFLTELRNAYTSYNQPTAYQIQPALLIGLFDDLFYRQITHFELHFNPSANLFILLGVLWAIAGGRRLPRPRAALALALGAVPPLALAFGAAPPGVIKAIPFLANIAHVDNTFSCVVIVHLLLLAGMGLRHCCGGRSLRLWNRERSTVLILLGVLLALYFGFLHAVHRTGKFVLPGGDVLPVSSFFTTYAAVLLAAVAMLPGALRRLAEPRGRRGAALTVAALCLVALHFRHSMYVATKFDAYVVNPRTRVALDAPSPAVDLIKKSLSEPGRVAGFGDVLMPGFNAVLGLESIASADAVLNPFHRALLDASGMSRKWSWRTVLDKKTLPEWQRFADLMNLRFYLGSPEDSEKPAPGLRQLGTSDLAVYESASVWPRAFFTDALAIYQHPQDFARLVREGDGRPFAAMQRLPEDVPLLARLTTADPAKRSIVPATGYRLTSNSTSFTIDAPAPGIAVLAEAYVGDDFEVRIDGAPATVLRANHAFNGVLIEQPGRHVISFVYWPRALTPALWLAACGGILLAGTSALVLNRTRTRRSKNSGPISEIPEGVARSLPLQE